jgi:hypothetical protein
MLAMEKIKKTLKVELGELPIDVPTDWQCNFEKELA